jgi:hypothetical protein
MRRKLALFPILLVTACLVAGFYGALHDQISYTISPDYYYSFKFNQFRIPVVLRNRIGASMVGWYASWWMGLLIGIPVLLLGLIMPDRKSYVTRSLVAFGVVAFTSLVVGLTALFNAGDMNSFDRVGTMHNHSYLGGGLGIITASIYLIIERMRLTRH